MNTLKSLKKFALSGSSILACMQIAGIAMAQTTDADAAVSAAEDQTAEERGDTIVVTGSSIRGVPPTGSNLISVDRNSIETIAAATTADLLTTVPQLNSFNSVATASLDGFGSFAPGMRGLPASATLPLMNGHRLVAAAANETNPDYPFIPSIAIERVEIVADGASSIYGSDAVAGVVNFITRKNFSGAEVSVNYGVADEYQAFTFNGIIGREWDGGSVLAAYQYAENSNITGGDRDYRILDFTPFGGIDTRGTSCPSPNVLVDSTFYAVNYAAPDLAPGTTNYCDNGAVADLVPDSRIHSLFASGHQDLNENVTLWGEILYSDMRDEIRAAPPVQAQFITSANPFFQAPPGSGATVEYVQFRPDNLIGDDHFLNTDERRVGNSSFGVDFSLPHDLNLSVYGTYDWAENDAFIPSINTAALSAAAAGTTTDTALDPFGTMTAPAVVAAILDSSTTVNIDQVTKLAAVKLDGPLGELPGGEMKFAIGAEARRETFEQSGFVGATPVPEDLERDITSLYGELFIPITGDGESVFRNLSMSLSGRHDDYSDFGSTTNPKIGVNWTPTDSLNLRGSYGTSFRAPGMRQVGATVGAYYLDAANSAVFANDPTRGLAQVNTVYLLGGNSDLQPEEATTYSFGADFNPSFLPDLNASVTYYNIEYTEVIGTPSAAIVFTDPTFASIVYRDPTPTELSDLLSIAVPVNLPSPLPAIGNLLDLRLNNFGIRETDGLDFNVNYRWTTDFGSVFADVTGNYILHYDSQQSPAAPVADSLKLGIPRSTARATLGAVSGPVSVFGFVNYRAGITNNFSTPTGVSSYDANSYTTADLRVSWRLPDSGATQGASLLLQVDNIFDQDPPFFPATDGIGGQYNPIGRYVALNIRKSF
ncbi:TonB-dependent receptor plug domain-containing protein [Parvularcula marina]|uniref:TonB-dependent receptor plug domain-containing protein n=1 Tax=Parvularcula marina TaxID=2292771 RepID=UPI003512F168